MNRSFPYNMRGRFFRNVYTFQIFILRLVINHTKLFKFLDNPRIISIDFIVELLMHLKISTSEQPFCKPPPNLGVKNLSRNISFL